MTTTPMRIDQELFDEARVAGRRDSRSAAQQIDHWARIGRELDSAPSVSRRDIRRVLAGDGSYDDLSEREQAIVRAEWEERIEERIAGLDLEAEFTASGRAWTDADAAGEPIARDPRQHDS